MKLFIIGDIFTGLKPWLIEDKAPKGMPAVYNFYKYLGNSREHSFFSIIINKEVNKEIKFPNGSKIKLLKISINNQYLFRIVALFYAYRLTKKYVKKNKYDAIYGMANYSLIAGILGRKFKLLSISRMFGAFSPKYIKEKKYFPIYTRFILEYLATKYAGDLFISTQDGTQHNILVDYAKPESEFHMMFNGIDKDFRNQLLDIPFIKKISSNKKIKISYIARLSWWKRQDIALNVAEILVKKYNLDIEMIFLGNGPDLEKLKKIAKDKKIEKNLRFLGALDRDNYVKALKDIDISLFMYDFSNLGNALWECMYAGKLIATKNSGDTGKYLKNNVNALVVEESDTGEQIAKKIVNNLEKDISHITKQARDDIKKWVTTWDERIEKELKMIEERVEKYKKVHNE